MNMKPRTALLLSSFIMMVSVSAAYYTSVATGRFDRGQVADTVSDSLIDPNETEEERARKGLLFQANFTVDPETGDLIPSDEESARIIDQALPSRNIREISTFHMLQQDIFVPAQIPAGTVAATVFAMKLTAFKPVVITGVSIQSDDADVFSKVARMELWADGEFVAPASAARVYENGVAEIDFAFQGLSIDKDRSVSLMVRSDIYPGASGATRFGLSSMSYPKRSPMMPLNVWNATTTVTQPPVIAPVFVDQYITVRSNDAAELSWRLPLDTTSATLTISCPDGVSAELLREKDRPSTAADDICGDGIAIDPASKGIDGLVFTSRAKGPVQAEATIRVVLPENQRYVREGASTILINEAAVSEEAN